MGTEAKTQRERVEAALDTLGDAIEEISVSIDVLETGILLFLLTDERRYLDEIAAKRNAEITEEPSGNDTWPVKRYALIDGVIVHQLTEEAKDDAKS